MTKKKITQKLEEINLDIENPYFWSDKLNAEKNLQTFSAEAPEELLLNDKVLQINILIWLLTTLIIFKLTS